MHMMKKLLYVLGSLSVLMMVACASWEGGTYRPMQQDFDKIRLDHMFVIDSLVMEFREKTGRYPFEEPGGKSATAVVIQTDAQERSHGGRVPLFFDLAIRAKDGEVAEKPAGVDMRSVQELEDELSSGLERNIVLPKDHQQVPVNKPSVYIYTYYLGVYEVTVFLHSQLPVSRNIGPYFNKITLSNSSDPQVGIWTAEELKLQGGLRDFFLSPFNKGGYELQTRL